MKTTLCLALFALCFVMNACSDEAADPKPGVVPGTANIQFDIINVNLSPTENEVATVMLYVYRQSLIGSDQTVLLDSTFTVRLADLSNTLSIAKTYRVSNVSEEAIVSCGSIRSQGEIRCGFNDAGGTLNRYELFAR